jgi:hypothetical protein
MLKKFQKGSSWTLAPVFERVERLLHKSNRSHLPLVNSLLFFKNIILIILFKNIYILYLKKTLKIVFFKKKINWEAYLLDC